MLEWMEAAACGGPQQRPDVNIMKKAEMAAELRVMYDESDEGSSDDLKKRLRAARKRGLHATVESGAGDEAMPDAIDLTGAGAGGGGASSGLASESASAGVAMAAGARGAALPHYKMKRPELLAELGEENCKGMNVATMKAKVAEKRANDKRAARAAATPVANIMIDAAADDAAAAPASCPSAPADLAAFGAGISASASAAHSASAAAGSPATVGAQPAKRAKRSVQQRRGNGGSETSEQQPASVAEQPAFALEEAALALQQPTPAQPTWQVQLEVAEANRVNGRLERVDEEAAVEHGLGRRAGGKRETSMAEEDPEVRAARDADVLKRVASEIGVDVKDLRSSIFKDPVVLDRLYNTRPMSYDSLANSMNKAKSLVPGCKYGKVTHFKGDSIRNILLMSDGLGMREDTRVFGRYNKNATSFDKNYAWDLPVGPLLAVAGFSPRYPADYDVPRAYNDVELAEGGKYYPLVLKVLPWLEEETKAAHERERTAKGNGTDVTGVKYLEYLFEARIVFLQDSAVLQDMFPKLCIYDHNVFEDPLWPEYKKSVLERVANAGANRTRGQLVAVADQNEHLGEALAGILQQLKLMQDEQAMFREAQAKRDKLLQALTYYFARTSGEVLQLAKGTEVMRQQHALIISMLTSDPSLNAMRMEAEAQAGISPLRLRPPQGAPSPGLSARALQPSALRLANIVFGGGAAAAATTVAAAEAALMLTGAGEGSGAESVAVASVVGGSNEEGRGGCTSAAPTAAASASQSAGAAALLRCEKADVGACNSVDTLLALILPLDAKRREEGWGSISHLIQKGVLSKFTGLMARYKVCSDYLNMCNFHFLSRIY